MIVRTLNKRKSVIYRYVFNCNICTINALALSLNKYVSTNYFLSIKVLYCNMQTFNASTQILQCLYLTHLISSQISPSVSSVSFSLFLSFNLLFCLSVSLSVCLFVCLSVCSPVCLSLSFSSLLLSLSYFVRPSFYLLYFWSVFLSVSLSLHFPLSPSPSSICLFDYQFFKLSVCLIINLSACLSVCLAVCLFLSFSLMCLFVSPYYSYPNQRSQVYS